tara:strand:+ start:582 stop:995 length:414 start_codon:yes stop_codon:yes gene_type:complete
LTKVLACIITRIVDFWLGEIMQMAAKSLGRKFGCFSCGTKFYDLNKAEALCPKCGCNQTDAPDRPDISTIAAKVMASTVTEAEDLSEMGPIADEMDVFGSDDMAGDDSSASSAKEKASTIEQSSDFDSDDFDADDDF